jgi:hypothetical protein
MSNLINLRTILIVSIIVIILFIYFNCDISENFTINNSESESNSNSNIEQIPASLDDIVGKKIRFYATLNGTEYILCALPKSSFKNYDSTDCASMAVVLIATSDFAKLQSSEKTFVAEEQQICEFKNNLVCKRMAGESMPETMPETMPESKPKCSSSNSDDCKMLPVDSALFNIYKIAHDPKKPSDKTSYKIIGHMRKNMTRIHTKSISLDNENSGSSNNVQTLCMQGPIATNASAQKDAWSSVEFVEVANQTDKNIKLIFKIDYPHKIKGTVTNNLKTGKPSIITDFVGICQKTYILNNSNINAKRLCLYNTQTDPNIITFSPRIN